MTGYTSRTGTRSTLAALRAAGWRLMVSPEDQRTEGFRYILENGAWPAHTRGQPIDLDRFEDAMRKLGRNADAIVLPDIVGGGEASLELSFRWMHRVLAIAPGLLPVQEGHEPWQVDELLGDRLGLFVGGRDVEWKLRTLPRWAAVARRRGAACHVGRVNTSRRIIACAIAGATSFDGTGPIRYPSTLARLDRAVRRSRAQLAAQLDDGRIAEEDRPWFE